MLYLRGWHRSLVGLSGGGQYLLLQALWLNSSPQNQSQFSICPKVIPEVTATKVHLRDDFAVFPVRHGSPFCFFLFFFFFSTSFALTTRHWRYFKALALENESPSGLTLLIKMSQIKAPLADKSPRQLCVGVKPGDTEAISNNIHKFNQVTKQVFAFH